MDILEEAAKPVNDLTNKGESKKLLESKTYEIRLENEEYELVNNIYEENIVEFKLFRKDIISSSYYKGEFTLDEINKLSYCFCKDVKEIFQFYSKIIQKNKLKLINIKEKNKIFLNFKNIINFDEEIEAKIELTEIKLSKDEIFQIIINELAYLKKQNTTKNNNEELEKKFNEYKNIISEKDKKIRELEKKITENEEKIKILFDDYNERKQKKEEAKKRKEEEEKIYSLNDNVNLINNLKFENVDKLRNIDVISNDLDINFTKSVAVYGKIKNNEIFYEVAFPDNKNGYNIIIFDLMLNKISNQIKNAHSSNIYRIKHYFEPSLKNHLLLSSSNDKSIKVWNISENPITNILSINGCFDGDNYSPFCLLFKNNNFFVLGGSRTEKKKKWNQKGIFIGDIQKSNIVYGKFIETTYLENKIYVILSGRFQTECLDYDDDTIKTYTNNKGKENVIANLFNKKGSLYLITGDMGNNICIYDFKTTDLIKEINIKDGNINALCSFSEKYLIASSGKTINITDMDNFIVAKTYSGHNNTIFGIEKIKIPEKGEFIITYDSNSIKIWK